MHPPPFPQKSTRLTRRSSTRLAQSSPATTIRESGQWVRGLVRHESNRVMLADTDPPPRYGTSIPEHDAFFAIVPRRGRVGTTHATLYPTSVTDA